MSVLTKILNCDTQYAGCIVTFEPDASGVMVRDGNKWVVAGSESMTVNSEGQFTDGFGAADALEVYGYSDATKPKKFTYHRTVVRGNTTLVDDHVYLQAGLELEWDDLVSVPADDGSSSSGGGGGSTLEVVNFDRDAAMAAMKEWPAGENAWKSTTAEVTIPAGGAIIVTSDVAYTTTSTTGLMMGRINWVVGDYPSYKIVPATTRQISLDITRDSLPLVGSLAVAEETTGTVVLGINGSDVTSTDINARVLVLG